MRINHNPPMDESEFDSIKDSIKNLSQRMTNGSPFSESSYDTSTKEYKLIDGLSKTIFEQAEKIVKLEKTINRQKEEEQVRDYVSRINKAIKNVDAALPNK